jgi:hypothetical protein
MSRALDDEVKAASMLIYEAIEEYVEVSSSKATR